MFGKSKLDSISKELGELRELVQSCLSGVDLLHRRIEENRETMMRTKDELHRHLNNVKQVVNAISVVERSVKIKSLFLVHNIATWDCLSSVHGAMSADDDFQVFVASINRRFPEEDRFGHEDETHAALTKLGVEHIRLNNPDSFADLDVVKKLKPDIIFRQSQWEADIPPGFNSVELRFARLCSIPYGIMNKLVHTQGAARATYGSYYANSCDMIFLLNKNELELTAQFRATGAEGLFVTGHPTIEAHRKAVPEWPVRRAGDAQKFKLVWCAHHTINDKWLKFGMFEQVFMDMLKWAETDASIEFVLRPHPALFPRLENNPDKEERERFIAFFDKWGALENTAVSRDNSYARLFKASDMLITDGITSLIEYQVHNKPLVFLEHEGHVPFSPSGEALMHGVHRVANLAEAKELANAFKSGAPDPKKMEQQKIYDAILSSENCAEKIIASIKRRIHCVEN